MLILSVDKYSCGLSESQTKLELIKENLALFQRYAIYHQERHFSNLLQKKNAQLEFEMIKMVIRKILKDPSLQEVKKANRMLKMVSKKIN